ncbi:MAG: hypothetical protein ABFS18_14010 [Thermodesulfobacteriota bacterium]
MGYGKLCVYGAFCLLLFPFGQVISNVRAKKMKTIRFIITCTFLLVGIVGCQTTGGVRQNDYPAEIKGIGDYPNYPLKAAGFDRAKIMTYAPGMTNISTAYNYLGSDAQIAATIYVYKKGGLQINAIQQFEAEKANIEKYHPGAQLIKTGKETFVKNGKELSALTAQYEYDGVFMHRQQPVYSELMLIEYGDKFIKLRSTSPKSQRSIASKKNLELMNVVNWAN